jgi:hypothetical protein
MENYSYNIKVEPDVEYTPRTPTHEDLQDTIDNLQIENSKLITKLARVQYDHSKLEGKWNKVLKENEELFESNHNMAWKCKEIEWNRRIVARSWKRRLGDRALYYRGVASEYAGLIKEYFSGWAHQYRHGPSLGFIWNYRPDDNYEDFGSIMHYPLDMPLVE